jgi:hypothetical protein
LPVLDAHQGLTVLRGALVDSAERALHLEEHLRQPVARRALGRGWRRRGTALIGDDASAGPPGEATAGRVPAAAGLAWADPVAAIACLTVTRAGGAPTRSSAMVSGLAISPPSVWPRGTRPH